MREGDQKREMRLRERGEDSVTGENKIETE